MIKQLYVDQYADLSIKQSYYKSKLKIVGMLVSIYGIDHKDVVALYRIRIFVRMTNSCTNFIVQFVTFLIGITRIL